ncbi:response regulator [Corallococcus sp. AB011P]|uniref:phosphorylase family protein n=1 Tax=Corallococcus sp. AB011P TaxID=2316735 RepID=UPI000EA307F6|nr:response regulator [Corallococcus sp. AB011P]RKG59857.1 response regulator [Corallococcus sp. AB011P]
MKVLVVEDDTAKLRQISAALVAVDGFSLKDLVHAVDVQSAKVALREERFDVLILDIALPLRVDLDVQQDAGLVLLEELLEREQYFVPEHIIGLTSHEELFAAGVERFSRRLLVLIKFDGGSGEWIRRLQSRVRHVLAAEAGRGAEVPAFLSHLAVVCALESPELESVLKIPWGWKQIRVPGDDTIYYQGKFEKDESEFVVHAAAAPRMGMSASAVLSTKMIASFRPKFIAMAGIAAGVRNRVKAGDVIVSDPSWDYGSGKWVLRDGKNSFLAAPHQIALDTSLRHKFRRLADNHSLLGRIRESWPAERPEHVLSLRVGPLASGAAVLADKGTIEGVVSQHRELLGVEMETYGVFSAASEAISPRPAPFSVKAVVDFADGEKDDRFQRYGAYVSAQVLRHFVEVML